MDNPRILIVDDEVDFRSTLIKRIRKRQVNASGACSGEEALEYLTAEAADVVILDLNMPGMGGLETLRQIKSRFPGTEVILLSGHASADLAIEGMEAGAFDYLMKPMDIDELLYKAMDAYHFKQIKEKKQKFNERRLAGEEGA